MAVQSWQKVSSKCATVLYKSMVELGYPNPPVEVSLGHRSAPVDIVNTVAHFDDLFCQIWTAISRAPMDFKPSPWVFEVSRQPLLFLYKKRPNSRRWNWVYPELTQQNVFDIFKEYAEGAIFLQ